ncbi:ATP synthase E chain domain containing protein [Amanita muscaria]
MASPTVNVVRYSALTFGIAYGWYHRKTLQAAYDKHKVEHAIHGRERLIKEAKEAYKRQKEARKDTLIMDPEDPRFDLEKVLAKYEKAAS